MYQLSTLPNGLRVASYSMPHVHSVAISIGIDVGARYEEQSNNGISHMLEHMAFKGTARRTARKIAEEFDAIGGNLNAYTSMEHTVYYARVLKEDTGLAMDILSDILLNSVFDQEELEKERQVILQEIAMHHDTPEELIFDRMSEMAYPNQPVGRSILGTPATVSGFERSDLRSYITSHYYASRMVVVAAGNVKHEELVAQVEKSFSGLTPGPICTPLIGHYKGGEERLTKDLEQVHLLLAFPSVSYHDPRYRTAQLMATLLGGGMSSRLFQEVREKRGLAYSIYAFVSSYSDSGLFGIYTGLGEKESSDIATIIADEMHKAADSIPEEEVARVKTQMVASIKMSQESVSSQSETITRHVLSYGRYKMMDEVIKEIEAVNVEDIRAILKTCLSGTPTLAAIGPVKKLQGYDKVKKAFAA